MSLLLLVAETISCDCKALKMIFFSKLSIWGNIAQNFKDPYLENGWS